MPEPKGFYGVVRRLVGAGDEPEANDNPTEERGESNMQRRDRELRQLGTGSDDPTPSRSPRSREPEYQSPEWYKRRERDFERDTSDRRK